MARSSKGNHRGRARRLFRHPVVVTLVGALIGTVAGWTVFSFSTLTGKSRFIVGGLLTGVITGLALIVYLRRAERFVLTEMTLSVPEFAEIKFAVSNEYKRVAWKMFIETLTRIATQPLAEEEGSLREALTSLYGVFTSTRELLKGMAPAKPTSGVTVEMLAVRMLNDEIRPFLAKWHIQLKMFESTLPKSPESNWSRNVDCRRELELLRNRLIDYSVAFGELAGLKDVHAFFQPSATMKKHAATR